MEVYLLDKGNEKSLLLTFLVGMWYYNPTLKRGMIMEYPRIVKDLGYFYTNASITEKDGIVEELTKKGFKVNIAPAYGVDDNMKDSCGIFIENYPDYIKYLVATSLGLEIPSLAHQVITEEGLFYKNIDSMLAISLNIDKNNEFSEGKRKLEKQYLLDLDKKYGITFGPSYHPVNKGAIIGFFGDQKRENIKGIYITDYKSFLEEAKKLLAKRLENAKVEKIGSCSLTRDKR